MGNRPAGKIAGYTAGIVAGVSYGLNPLFAKSLLAGGVAVSSMLFFRYAIALLLMAGWMAVRHERFRVSARQLPLLVFMGLLFASSSLTLFASYRYIPSGLATTLVYLYPAFTALMMVCMGKKQGLNTWIAIFGTIAGVVLLCLPDGSVTLHWAGLLLACTSAFVYALYLVLVNNSRRIEDVSAHTITLHALMTGTLLFAALTIAGGSGFTTGIDSASAWLNLAGLAVFPTMISLLALSISTRRIGATRTAVLGVFEPLTALLIGVAVYGEPMNAAMGIGVAVCIASILYMIISDRSVS